MEIFPATLRDLHTLSVRSKKSKMGTSNKNPFIFNFDFPKLSQRPNNTHPTEIYMPNKKNVPVRMPFLIPWKAT